MKTFKNISKAIKFVELVIEGTYGEDCLALNDFSKYDSKAVKENLKYFKEAYVVIRGQFGCQDGGWNRRGAMNVADEWKSSATHLIRFYKEDNGIIEISSEKL